MSEKKKSTWWLWVIVGALGLGAIILGAGWCSASKKPAQINTIIKGLPPRTVNHWLHVLGGLDNSGEPQKEVPSWQPEMHYDTILDVDSIVIQNLAIDFVHVWPGIVGMGWLDSLGHYHYTHWDFPDTRYGLHAGVTGGVPSVTVYDFGKYIEKEKKWHIEIELGGGVLVPVNAQDTSLFIRPDYGTAARLVLGEYRLRRLSFEIVPIELGVSNQGFTARVKARMIF